jgi:hypothetical protein
MASEYVPAWVEILKRAGYPTRAIVIDFESYFDEDYGFKSSTIEYVTDERWEILGCAFLEMDGQAPFADYSSSRFEIGEEKVTAHIRYLQGLYGHDLGNITVIAQNATFDCTVLWKHFDIHPRFIVDTLGLARAWNSRDNHDLDTMAKRLGLPPKGDTTQFKGVTFKRRIVRKKGRGKGPKLPVQRPLATDEQVVALSTYAQNDACREWEAFAILLPRLSNPVVELSLIKHHLELFTKPVLKVDYVKGEEIIQAMEKEIDAALPIGRTREEISGDKSFEYLLLGALEQAGDHAQKYYKISTKVKGKYNLAIAKTDPERELLLEHPHPQVRVLMEAKAAIDSWPNHISRVTRIMDQAKANGGLLPVPLKYHGAHTGRASGSEKINLQNLGSRGHELVNSIRNMLIADDGQRLVIVDCSQIEARVTGWIAGQWDLIEKFKNKQEIYCDFASKVLGIPCRKARKTDIPAIAARLTWARNAVGKIGVLGCGYGMGAKKCVGYAKGAIDLDTAEKIVKVYREDNAKIVAFWHSIEKAFVYTAKYHRPCELERGLRFSSTSDCNVVITLPNGREIHYVKVKVTENQYGRATPEVYNAVEHSWEHIWGGTLTENVVQAMSRDILLEAMLRLEPEIHTALHIHDELVISTPADGAEGVLITAIVAMSQTPSWAPGLPLGAEGTISERYGKH